VAWSAGKAPPAAAPAAARKKLSCFLRTGCTRAAWGKGRAWLGCAFLFPHSLNSVAHAPPCRPVSATTMMSLFRAGARRPTAASHGAYLDVEAGLLGLLAVPFALSPAVLLHAPSSAAAAINSSAVSVFMRLLLVPVEGKPTIAQNDARLCKRASYSTVQVFEPSIRLNLSTASSTSF
jgi:hypothetical protein